MRILGALLLGGVAMTHVLDLPDKLREAHYMAVLFCLLIIASLLLGWMLVVGRAVRAAWISAALLCVAAIAGYILSRSVGLPQIEDHVGQWADPLGMAALACEAGVVALASARAAA
jgi:uncharacterized membrane protein YphA (DoxX/SURF4 family)